MTFKLYSTDDGRVPPIQYLPAEAITPKVGLCLAFDTNNSGQLEISTQPTYICMQEASAAVTAGDLIPVVAIQKDQVWESALDGNTSYKLGETADIASGGLLIDADASTNNTFRMEYMEAATSGAIVRGRFVV